MALIIKIVNSGLSFMMVLLLARWMDEGEYGRFAMAFSLATFLSMVALGGQHIFVLRYIPQYEGQEKPNLWNGAITFSWKVVLKACFSTAILTALGIFVYSRLERGQALDFLYWAAFLLAPMALAEYVSSLLRAHGYIVAALVPRDIIWRLVILIIGFTLTSAGVNLTAPTVLFYSSLALVIIILPQFLMNARTIKEKALTGKSAEEKIDWWSSTRSLWVSSVFAGVTQHLSILIVGYMLSASNAGLFFVAIKTASLASIPLTAVNIIYAPQISLLYHSGKIKELISCLLYIMAICGLLGIMIFLIFVFLGKDILALFGAEYVSAYNILIIFGVGYLVNSCFGPNGYFLTMSGNHTILVKVQMIVELIGLLFLMVIYNFHDMAYAALAVSGTLILWNGCIGYFCFRIAQKDLL